MNHNYSNVELRDIHYFYGVARGSARAARRMYQEAYPQRILPQPRMFTGIHRRLGEFGAFKISRHDAGRPRRTRTPAVEIRILKSV